MAGRLKKVKVDWHKDCIELSSGKFVLAVTTKVGPRIISARVNGGANLLAVMPEATPAIANTEFKLYGGHRLWHAPEALPRTYAPDNAPVALAETEEGLAFGSGTEASTGMEKSMIITPLGDERFRITHRITNRNAWRVEVSPWALSVMAPGGMAVLPMFRDPHANPFAPDRQVQLWPYTDFNDPRLSFGKDFVFLRQDSKAKKPCKLGMGGDCGWIAYVNGGQGLIKHFEFFADAVYPDNGCAMEAYSCAEFCEIETVAPVYPLEPGDTAEHVELWHGVAGLPAIKTEADVRKHLEPLVGDTLLETESDCGCGCDHDHE